MTPGQVEVVDGRTFYMPTLPGTFAPRSKGHMHVLRIQAYSLEGPLVALMGCRYCAKTTVVLPNPGLRKMPEGFSAAAWSNFLAAAARRGNGDG